MMMPKLLVATIRIRSIKRGFFGDDVEFQLVDSSDRILARSRTFNTPYKDEARHHNETPQSERTQAVWDGFIEKLLNDGWDIMPTEPRRWHALTLRRSAD